MTVPALTDEPLHCADGKLPLKVVVQRGIDICRGLQDLHEAGITMQTLRQVTAHTSTHAGWATHACIAGLYYMCLHHHPCLDSSPPSASFRHDLLSRAMRANISYCHGQ